MGYDDKSKKGIPYGVSDYELIRSGNYYYVDKTPFLKSLNETGRYLFFIRPRRFGKSLFISLLEAYYDVFYKDRFEELFENTWIYDNPGEERGKYLVLSFNFSLVADGPGGLASSFLNHIRGRVVDFLQKYNPYLEPNRERNYFVNAIEESDSASDILSNLLLLCKGVGQKLYVLIDEYDNFANTLLSTEGEHAYRDLTHGAGFFLSFFKVLKGGTTGMGAPITRSFITGVSPVTMDDVTSGYNIGKNVSTDANFNTMLGFTGDEVIGLIDYYRLQGQVYHPTSQLIEIMDQWYGNYLFSEDDDTRLYNSDMILYFWDHYLEQKKLPKELIDRNIRIDYGKLRHLIIVDQDKSRKRLPNGNFTRLRTIVEKGEISARIKQAFPLENLTDKDNFISLLFYFGLLTIKSAGLDDLLLIIPNETIRHLYYDYIKEAYQETDVFSLDLSQYSLLMKNMAQSGDWQPLFDYISLRMSESMSLRDLISGEKSIQAFLNVYLGLSDLYIIHSEKELNKGYADLVMEPFLARYEGIKYSYLIEIKYIKLGENASEDKKEKLIAEAAKQLSQYSADQKFNKRIAKTQLIKLAIIFSGHQLLHISQLP